MKTFENISLNEYKISSWLNQYIIEWNYDIGWYTEIVNYFMVATPITDHLDLAKPYKENKQEVGCKAQRIN